MPQPGCFVLVAREARSSPAPEDVEHLKRLADGDAFHDINPDVMEILDGLDDPLLPLMRDIIAEEARPSTVAERRARYERWLVSGSVLHQGFAREALQKDRDRKQPW